MATRLCRSHPPPNSRRCWCKLRARDIQAAERETIKAQSEVAALRPEADALIQAVVAAVTFATFREEPPRQRRQLRRYGAQYRYLPGEPTETEGEGLG